jgi:hypothetical protein
MPAALGNIPAYGGLCTPEASRRPGFSVAEAALRLRRLAFVKQRLALLAAAHLNSTPEWEVKSALALHAWLDAGHATSLRQRILELREPLAKLDEPPAPALTAVMEEALRSANTLELLAAVYGVLRPALAESIEHYLAQTNPLADHPSCRVLRLMLIEEKQAIEWGRAALAVLAETSASREQSETWSAHLRAYLDAAGGIDGQGGHASAPLPPSRAATPYRADVLPRRDARFSGLYDTSTPADVVYLDDSRPAAERNLALYFKRLREMDVPEVVAGIIAETPGKPWEYYADLLRQMWDEARHALLGQAELEARGVDWTALPVNVTFSFKLAKFCAPLERHILLYAIEQSLMPARRGKRYEWMLARKARDPLSTTFQDFDWADEVLHVAIARRHLRGDLKGGLEEARRRADDLWVRIAQRIESEPLPADAAPADWWERFAESVLGKKPAPVPETHVKDWRPLSA